MICTNCAQDNRDVRRAYLDKLLSELVQDGQHGAHLGSLLPGGIRTATYIHSTSEPLQVSGVRVVRAVINQWMQSVRH